jgi:hypothetical protein
MERQIIFRDYQEQQAQDHIDLQNFTRTSLDHLVVDAVTDSRKYAGFAVSKTAQAEVQVSAGRFYDVAGAVYSRSGTLVQSMVAYLPAVAKKYVALVAYGTETETDVEERDFLVDVDTGRTEPDAVATTRSRDAVLSMVQGSESADPQPPAIPVGQVAVAYILLDTIQVVSVTQLTDNEVVSTGDLDDRTDGLETFRDQVGPRIASLASDIASLQNRMNSLGSNRSLQSLSEDVARIRESLRYPATASDYGADFFLTNLHSDYENALMQGYDALVEEGCRFPDANADEFEISMFSANDPNASYSNGLLLPKYTDAVRLATSYEETAVYELGIAQYGYQTVEMKQGYLSRTRLRFGGSRYVCSNQWEWGGVEGEDAPSNLYDFDTWELITVSEAWWDPANPAHEWLRYDSYWVDTWKEPYMYAQTVDHSITGAMIAQSFLASNDMWCTKLSVFITAKAANEDIHIALCEMNAGMPNLNRAIAKVAYGQANIVVGWNHITIPPTFLQKGNKYAFVIVSNANHKVGLVSGQSYLDGTFYYSTDGAYYQGDLTKDLMFQVWAARFESPQVTIEFAPINLDGGFRYVDILAELWMPFSTALVFEMRPSGAGAWIPLTRDNATTLLATAPPLAQFRARFDGTRDMHAGIKLVGSRVHISRPKLAFKHVTEEITFETPADEIHVKVRLEGFNETPHDHTCTLLHGSGLAIESEPNSVVTTLLNAVLKQYQREYLFVLSSNETKIAIVQQGTTNTAQDTYHVAERTYYAQ